LLKILIINPFWRNYHSQEVLSQIIKRRGKRTPTKLNAAEI